jgi:inner membrane protein
MTSKTHNAISFAALLTAAVLTPVQALNFLTLFSCIVGNIIGTLSPDLDQASNRLWDFLPGGDFTGRIFRPLFMGHRALSHSLLGVFIYYELIKWALPMILNPLFVDINLVLASVMIGFITHLAADGITEDGLPLFFPFKIRVGFPPITSWRIKTGRWFENLVVLPGTAAYIIWLAIEYREQLVSTLRLIQN